MSGTKRRDDNLERERTALLIEIEAQIQDGRPLSDELISRIAAVAAADLERTSTEQTLSGRLHRDVGDQVRALFAAAGITDAVRGSTMHDAESRVYVRSHSRGRIEIGTVDTTRLLAIATSYGEELEAALGRSRWEPALKKRSETKGRLRAKAHELQQQGWSVPRIAKKINRTERWTRELLKNGD